MIRALSVLASVVVLAACSSGTDPATTTSTAPSTTTTTITVATTSTASTTTTTTTTPTTTIPPASDPPTTFVAVTDDYEAVEVDTASGAILRSLGRVSDASDVENAECAACVNAVDRVWRTRDGSTFIISECCEPAAGAITVLGESELPMTSETPSTLSFWTASPGPGRQVAYGGYTIAIGHASDPEDVETEQFVYAVGITWVDASTVAWLDPGIEGPAGITVLDLGTGARTTTEYPDFANWHLDGLAADRHGALHTVRHDGDGTSTLVVVTAGGDVVEEDIEDGALLGGFDPSGTFLIHTDADGIVRWRGGGGAGVLAEGFIFASW